MLISSERVFRASILAIVFTTAQPQSVKAVIGMQMARNNWKTSVRKNQPSAISGLSVHWKTPH